MDADAYCRERAAEPGSTLYYATLFLPADSRNLSIAVEALRLELLNVIHRASDWSVARTRIAWWTNEIVAARDGDPTHPATRAVSAATSAATWRSPEWISLLGELTRVTQAGGLDTDEDRDRLCQALGGCLAPVVARCASSAIWRDTGFWLQRGEFVRGPVAPAPAGLHYLPRHEFGDRSRTVAPGESPAPESVECRLRSEARACLDALKSIEKSARPGLDPMSASLRTRVLVELASLRQVLRRPAVIPGRIRSITPIRKLWIAWRAFR